MQMTEAAARSATVKHMPCLEMMFAKLVSFRQWSSQTRTCAHRCIPFFSCSYLLFCCWRVWGCTVGCGSDASSGRWMSRCRTKSGRIYIPFRLHIWNMEFAEEELITPSKPEKRRSNWSPFSLEFPWIMSFKTCSRFTRTRQKKQNGARRIVSSLRVATLPRIAAGASHNWRVAGGPCHNAALHRTQTFIKLPAFWPMGRKHSWRTFGIKLQMKTWHVMISAIGCTEGRLFRLDVVSSICILFCVSPVSCDSRAFVHVQVLRSRSLGVVLMTSTHWIVIEFRFCMQTRIFWIGGVPSRHVLVCWGHGPWERTTHAPGTARWTVVSWMPCKRPRTAPKLHGFCLGYGVTGSTTCTGPWNDGGTGKRRCLANQIALTSTSGGVSLWTTSSGCWKEIRLSLRNCLAFLESSWKELGRCWCVSTSWRVVLTQLAFGVFSRFLWPVRRTYRPLWLCQMSKSRESTP